MPLRASCSFQLEIGTDIDDNFWIGLNAPQGFMLIPTLRLCA